MPPYYRRPFYRRNWWNSRYRRRRFRRRGLRKTFRYRKRRQRKVKRRFKYYKKYKKLKRIPIQQWQPSAIRNSRIQGYLCLFQAGNGRASNNYVNTKESLVPEHTPSGGGWSMQQLTLSNLYTQNCELQNVWTKSNKRLNLCRYRGAKITLFREQFTDYVFSWLLETPKTVEKYFYCSYHPMNMLRHNRKVIVPSFYSQPHKRKPYKKIYIPPPKLLKNQWFFQQHLSTFPLVSFVASACSLQGMYGSDKSINNNCTFWCLDTNFMKIPTFQYRTETTPNFGYTPQRDIYLWGLSNGKDIFSENTISDSIYLGNSMLNQAGTYVPKTNPTQYKMSQWGNPFYWWYFTHHTRTFITTGTNTPTELIKTPQKHLEDSWLMEKDYAFTVRYNPFKDKGTGNEVYFIPNYDKSKLDWEPTSDPSLLFTNLPLYIIFWGIEDMLKKMGKCQHLDDDWICVIRSKYLYPPEKYYVPLSYNFVHGSGPYDTDRENIAPLDEVHWYPKYKFQREAINNIIQTGPAVIRFDHSQNIQAKIKYDLYFKWGGNPSPMENAVDPTTQPVTPTPSGLYFQNETDDPTQSIENFLYSWDTRRDFITPKATERIKKSTTHEKYLFTDGMPTSTDLPLQETTTQKKETPETQEATLLLQLNRIQQFNQQLQHRFTKLKQLFSDP